MNAIQHSVRAAIANARLVRASQAHELPPVESYEQEPEAARADEHAANAQPSDGARALALIWYATLNRAVHQAELVSGLLLAGSLFLVFGESNSGKTFFLLDLVLAVASGNQWCSRRVSKGLVLYVAGEGSASVRNRVAAYRQAHPEVPSELPFAIIPEAVNFLSVDAVTSLIATVRIAEALSGEKVVLIVVDTLARSLLGGDENSAEDMGTLIANADRVRAETGAALGFVHHTGKDSTKGARGHSSLRAAVDTEILVSGQSGTRAVTITKQRDLPADAPFAFELVPTVIGRTEEGQYSQDIASCTVRYTDAPVTAKPKSGGVNQQRAMSALKEWARTNPEATAITSIDIRALLKAQKLDDRRRPEVLDYMVNIRILTPSIGGFTFDRTML